MIWRESGGMGKCSKALTNCKNTGNAEASGENKHRVFFGPSGCWEAGPRGEGEKCRKSDAILKIQGNGRGRK